VHVEHYNDGKFEGRQYYQGWYRDGMTPELIRNDNGELYGRDHEQNNRNYDVLLERGVTAIVMLRWVAAHVYLLL
jgi:hypothetical protein